MMEQKPIRGLDPLDPPSPEIASLYLQEAEVVEQRREDRIDRRRMARLTFIDGAAFATVIAVSMANVGSAYSSNGTMVLMIPLIIWFLLAGELREKYGFQGRAGTPELPWRLGLLAVIVIAIAATLWINGAGGEAPWALRVLPIIASLAVFGGLGVRELRKVGPGGRYAPIREPLTRSARLTTLGLGVLLGGLVLAIGAPGTLLWGALLVSYLLIGSWMIASQIGSRMPAVGTMWGWPQWGAYILAALALAVLALLGAHTSVVTLAVSGIAAGAVVIVFACAAFLGGRDG